MKAKKLICAILIVCCSVMTFAACSPAGSLKFDGIKKVQSNCYVDTYGSNLYTFVYKNPTPGEKKVFYRADCSGNLAVAVYVMTGYKWEFGFHYMGHTIASGGTNLIGFKPIISDSANDDSSWKSEPLHATIKVSYKQSKDTSEAEYIIETYEFDLPPLYS